MEVVIASNPNEEDLFAEIYYRGTYWARVIYDHTTSAFTLLIFPDIIPVRNEYGDYVFDLVEVQEALEKAKQRLIERGYGSGRE